MNNIVKVECMHFWSDWTDIKEIEINLDEYVFFEIDYRGKDSWHIKGHKCGSEHRWTEEELSDHQTHMTVENFSHARYQGLIICITAVVFMMIYKDFLNL